MRRRNAHQSRLLLKVLGLPGWEILDIHENEHDLLIEARPPGPSCCQKCGVVDARLRKVGRFPLLVMHTPALGKRVGINIHRDRYGCRECKKTFYYRPAELSGKREITKALNQWIWDQSLRRNFADVARDVGLNEKTIAKIFMHEFDRREKETKRPVPRWIGIDEVQLLSWRRSDKTLTRRGKLQCILTDYERGTIYELLQNHDHDTLVTALRKIAIKGGNPSGFALDMNKNYRRAIREVFPRAEVVVDKFHVTQQIDSAFTKVRTALQAELRREAKALAAKGEETRSSELEALASGLSRDGVRLIKKPKIGARLKKKTKRPREKKELVDKTLFSEPELWFGRYPQLRAAYDAKEQLYEIYHTRKREEAAQRYDDWVDSLDDDVRPAFEALIKTFENWRQEIFNGWNRFYGQPTNGRTEAANGVLKQRRRVGRGYAFATFRALAIYGVGRLETRPPFGEGLKSQARFRKRRELLPKDKRKRKRPGDRTPRDVEKLDWEKESASDEARRPKPPETQLSIGF